MAFTSKELQESIEELARLQEEIAVIDKKFAEAQENFPEDVNTDNADKNQVEILLAEAKTRAEEEGRKRRERYELDHPVVLSEPKLKSPRRNGLMIQLCFLNLVLLYVTMIHTCFPSH